MAKKTPDEPQYSWKKPWLFDDIHKMRKYITESEMYKRLKILERHSSFKKPYWNFRSHPHGELIYSWPGFPPRDRIPPWEPPDDGGDNSECKMACNGGLLDCYNGGCDTITCICGEPPMEGFIIEDPTGAAWIEGQGSAQLQVCIPPQKVDSEGYHEIIVSVIDSRGQETETVHPLVDCQQCCEVFTLSGASTVNPGDPWVGTIDPCCDGVDIEVTLECGTVPFSLSPDGCTITVTISDTAACGTMTVKATQDVDGCDVQFAQLPVRINNTGQGGAWGDAVINSNQGCLDCVFGGSTYTRSPCIKENSGKKYGLGADCSLDWDIQCQGDVAPSCDTCSYSSGAQPPCMGGQTPCFSTTDNCGETWCQEVDWNECIWSCSC